MGKKKQNKDTLTLLVILASIIVIGAGLAFFQRGDNLKEFSINGEQKKEKEQDDISKTVVYVSIAASVIVIAIYTVKKIHEKKKREEERRIIENKKRELEEARERVERARMEEFAKVSANEISRKRSENIEIDRGSTIKHKFDYSSLSGLDDDDDEDDRFEIKEEKKISRKIGHNKISKIKLFIKKLVHKLRKDI